MPDENTNYSNYVCINKGLWNAVLAEHFKMFTQLKKQTNQRQATQAKYYEKNKARLSGLSRNYYQNIVKTKRILAKSQETESDSE